MKSILSVISRIVLVIVVLLITFSPVYLFWILHEHYQFVSFAFLGIVILVLWQIVIAVMSLVSIINDEISEALAALLLGLPAYISALLLYKSQIIWPIYVATIIILILVLLLSIAKITPYEVASKERRFYNRIAFEKHLRSASYKTKAYYPTEKLKTADIETLKKIIIAKELEILRKDRIAEDIKEIIQKNDLRSYSAHGVFAVERKCRVEYYNPMEVNHEYPLEIGLLKSKFEKTLLEGCEVRWGNVKFIPEEIEPEVEIMPVSAFFVFAPTKRTLKIRTDQDGYTDFKMLPTRLPDTPKVDVRIEFLYKNEPVGALNFDVKIQDKFKIIDGIKISHEDWGGVIAIGGGLTTLGIFLHISSLIYESLEYASHLVFLLIAFSLIASLIAFCLGIYLEKNKSRKVSEVFE